MILLISTIQICVVLASTLVGIKFLPNEESKVERKYILPFCLVDLVTSSILIIKDFSETDFYFLTHFQTLFYLSEIFLLVAYIKDIIGMKKSYVVSVVFVAIFPFVSLLLTNYLTDLGEAFVGIYITALSLKYFYWLMKNDEPLVLVKTKHFWIITGMMICYSTTITTSIFTLIMLLRPYHSDRYFMDIGFNFTFKVMNILMHIFFIKGFICTEARNSYLSPQS